MNEYTQKHIVELKGASNRTFGLLFSIVFAVNACYPLLTGGSMRQWSLIAAGVFAGLALLIPAVLAPANRVWMKFGELLHHIVSPVALGVVFYVAVLPTGLILRLLGKDPCVCVSTQAQPATGSSAIRPVLQQSHSTISSRNSPCLYLTN